MATSNKAVATEVSCPECNGRLQTDAAESVCQSCGLVAESDRMDHGPEWRSFEGGERDPRRAKPANRDLQDRGLGSQVGNYYERDGKHSRFDRLHRQAKTDTKHDRNRGYATGEIHRIGHALELGGSLTKQAKRLFRQLHDKGVCIGRDLDTIAATCVYTTCRIHQRGLTPAEVAEVSRTDETPISRRHKWACNELGLAVPPPDPRQRVRVVASEFGVRQAGVRGVLDRIDAMDEAEVYRGSPSVLAAALLYDSELGLTQRELGEVAGCTATAIRHRLEDVE